MVITRQIKDMKKALLQKNVKLVHVGENRKSRPDTFTFAECCMKFDVTSIK